MFETKCIMIIQTSSRIQTFQSYPISITIILEIVAMHSGHVIKEGETKPAPMNRNE